MFIDNMNDDNIPTRHERCLSYIDFGYLSLPMLTDKRSYLGIMN